MDYTTISLTTATKIGEIYYLNFSFPAFGYVRGQLWKDMKVFIRNNLGAYQTQFNNLYSHDNFEILRMEYFKTTFTIAGKSKDGNPLGSYGFAEKWSEWFGLHDVSFLIAFYYEGNESISMGFPSVAKPSLLGNVLANKSMLLVLGLGLTLWYAQSKGWLKKLLKGK